MARNISSTSLIAIAALFATMVAQADSEPVHDAAVAVIPGALVAFIWAPLLGFCFVSAAALLWMIRADARKTARRNYRDARAALAAPAAPRKSMRIA